MPTSKNKRKNGRVKTGGFRHYVEQRKRIDRKTAARSYTSVEEVKRDAKCLLARKQWYERGQSRMAWLTMLAARPDAIVTAQTKSQFALRRWAEGDVDDDDFNIVASSLMIGYLLAKRLPLEGVEQIFAVLHEAAYMAVTCVRLHNRQHPIPEANLAPIHTGLTVAQDLMTLADETDRHILIDVLELNSKEYAKAHPGEQALWQRDLLGRYADRVAQWYQDDWQEDAPWIAAQKATANQVK